MQFRHLIVLLIVFRLALLIFFIVSHGRYMDDDSFLYVDLAQHLLEQHQFVSSLSLLAPLEPEVFRTPGYPFFLALISGSGMSNPYWAVLWQEVIYLLAAFVFFHFGQLLLGERLCRMGLVFLLIEPGGLAYSKLLLSETLFLPFFISGLLSVGYYLRKQHWLYLLLAGGLFGLGALVRPAVLYLPIVAAAIVVLSQIRSFRHWRDAGILLFAFMVVISPWLMRNYQEFGKPFMTGQQSNMFANYHVPIVWESVRGIPFWEGHKIIKLHVEEAAIEQAKKLGRDLSKVEFFNIQQGIASQQLLQYPVAYAKQWFFGSLKTMNGINMTELYHGFRYQENRLHYFDVKANSFVERVYVFVINQDVPVLIMVFLRILISAFALLGALAIIQKKDAFLWLMMLANFYFICVPGPMGYARFRFPVEVFWFIQAAIGYGWCLGLFRKKYRS